MAIVILCDILGILGLIGQGFFLLYAIGRLPLPVTLYGVAALAMASISFVSMVIRLDKAELLKAKHECEMRSHFKIGGKDNVVDD